MFCKSNKSMHVTQFTAYSIPNRYLESIMGGVCVTQEYSE